MHKLRLFLIIALMLVLTTAVYAQDDFCGDLSEADCELYYRLEAGQVPDSAAFESDMNVSFNSEETTFDMTAKVNGSYVYDVEVVRAYLESIQDVSLLDITPNTFIGFIESGVAAFNADLSIEVDLPMLAMMMPMNPITVDLWLVNGVAYADLTPLSVMMEDESMAGVYGVDAFEAIRLALGSVTIGDLMEAGGNGDKSMSNNDFDVDFSGLQNQFNPPILEDKDIDFVTLTRLDDEESDGQVIAVFQTVVNVADIYKNEKIVAVMENYIPADAGIDAEELAQALITGMGENSTVTVVEKYGMDDGYLYEINILVDYTIDPAPFMELSDEVLSEEEAPGLFLLNADFNLTRSSINAVESIDLPADAVVVPAQALMEMMHSGED